MLALARGSRADEVDDGAGPEFVVGATVHGDGYPPPSPTGEADVSTVAAHSIMTDPATKSVAGTSGPRA